MIFNPFLPLNCTRITNKLRFSKMFVKFKLSKCPYSMCTIQSCFHRLTLKKQKQS